MKNQNSNIVFVATLSAVITFLSTVAFFANKEAKEDTSKEEIEAKAIIISQYNLKKEYGWKDIILWNESKEIFEKAYKTKLHWINYNMGFQRDPMCGDPMGGNSGDWKYEKVCFNFVWPPNVPNILEKIVVESRGKTLVIIGSIHNNGQNFFGDVYWCE